jgi:hypothetical protein
LTVPAGSISASFTVTTAEVTASTPVSIFAVYGSVIRTAALTIHPPGSAPGALPAPTLVSPSNGAQFRRGRTISFDWSDVSGAASYTMQIDDSSAFSTSLVLERNRTTSSFSTSSLPTGTFWWRVRANDSSGTPGAWSVVRTLEVRR